MIVRVIVSSLAAAVLVLGMTMSWRERSGPQSTLASALIVLAWLLFAGLALAHAGEICIASQYGVGDGYHGRRTASGAIFNTYAGASGRDDDPYTIARPARADLGRKFRIVNLRNGVSIEALSTDLGPFIAGRCVDLGRAGADALGIGGLGWVRVERLD